MAKQTFIAENAIPLLEKGEPTLQFDIWGTESRYTDGRPILWVGLTPEGWIFVTNMLHNSGPEGKCVAQAIASRFDFKYREEP